MKRRTTPKPRAHRASLLLGLGVILVSVIRAWGVTHGDLVLYDEGMALSQGHDLVYLMTHPGSVSSRYRLPNNGKLVYDLLVGSLLTIGVSPFAMVWVSVISGTIMISTISALLYRRLGLVAALAGLSLAGLLPISIMYSHRTLADEVSVATLALTLVALARVLDSAAPSRRSVSVALMLAALCVAVNYRYAEIALPLLTIVALRRTFARRYGRLFALGIMVLPGIGVAVVYVVLRVAHWSDHDVLRGQPFTNLSFYPKVFANPPSVIFGALLLAGLVACWKQRQRLDLFTTVMIGGLIGQILLVTVVESKAPRAVLGIVPFAAIIAAHAFDLVPRTRTGLRIAGITSVLAITTASGITGSQDARVVSAMPALAVWLSTHPGKVADDRLFNMVMIDPSQEPDPLTDVTTVRALRARGDRWAIVDAENWLIPYPTTTPGAGAYAPGAVVAELLSCATASARFDDVGEWSPYFFLENADPHRLSYDEALSWLAAGKQATHGQMIVYDLAEQTRC